MIQHQYNASICNLWVDAIVFLNISLIITSKTNLVMILIIHNILILAINHWVKTLTQLRKITLDDMELNSILDIKAICNGKSNQISMHFRRLLWIKGGELHLIHYIRVVARYNKIFLSTSSAKLHVLCTPLATIRHFRLNVMQNTSSNDASFMLSTPKNWHLQLWKFQI